MKHVGEDPPSFFYCGSVVDFGFINSQTSKNILTAEIVSKIHLIYYLMFIYTIIEQF